ncbi:aflatoxin biosynthesis ketoreductase nor-1 [Cercophora newfieldiana]|uniref:Aflatoxin biosynthesis ketoreductase nor-1 n=1 Tax=Cercophora newfieldiana TaxID=92897 RepID=A0AA39Y9S3_9PEZI|nr:aflatoxin biosynthesis ketoreductase nor-1 [Cercophora newfieldiana]
MSTTTNVLITGVSRGLGRALAELYLSRPNHTVIGSVRDLSSLTATTLRSTTPAPGSRLILVKIEVTSPTDYTSAITHLTTAESITHLDIVIANAGINGELTTVADTPISDLKEVLDVNTVGPILLFQATLPLLLKSKNPKWIAMSTISSSIGSLDQTAAFPTASYGLSKAAFNFATRSIHFQHEGIVAVAVHPGWVKTDMGNASAKVFGLESAAVEVEDSVRAVVGIIDKATKENESGKLIGFDGNVIPW